MARDLKYFTSERFIHDDLAADAANLEDKVRDNWRKHRKIETTAITWPAEHLKADDGKTITHAVGRHIPDHYTDAEKFNALKEMIQRTQAYGIALIERYGLELRILFETKHGARAWIIPLERHGDILVPGKTKVKDNADCLGLLWRPKQGVS